MALHRFEDSVASVDPCEFRGVYRCSQAPTLRPLNFVRVDDAALGLDATVAGARATARQHGLAAIVVDVSFGLNTNARFEGTDGSGREWLRVPRGMYVIDGKPHTPAHQVQQISLDEFIAARRAFFAATSHYDAAQIKEEEEAARVVAGAMRTQQWGAQGGGVLVSVGEIYFIGDTAQLESLSTLPRWEGKGFGTAVTAARVNEAVAGGAELVFAQIEAGNGRSVKVHERVGFIRVGSRQVFVLDSALRGTR
jgi:RimJ/RimL family protein N-acetyltransferase